MTKIYVLPLWNYKHVITEPEGTKVVSTVAKNCRDLSPFCLGPCKLYHNYTSKNMENAWQFAKVYPEHYSGFGRPTAAYWSWARRGWEDTKAHRYPMGKGRKPVGSWWDGELLDYITARKNIYAPLYAEQVVKTDTYHNLKRGIKEKKWHTLILLDYDAYNHHHLRMSLTDVLNNPEKKMGHAFVLSMLLKNDEALNHLGADR